MEKLSDGAIVEWSWGTGAEMGKVQQGFTEKVSRNIDGETVTLEATPDDPVYLVEKLDGSQVLKVHSEIRVV